MYETQWSNQEFKHNPANDNLGTSLRRPVLCSLAAVKFTAVHLLAGLPVKK